MEMKSIISAKLEWDGEMRGIQLHERISLDDFSRLCRSMFLREGRIDFKFQNEQEQWITIFSDLELRSVFNLDLPLVRFSLAQNLEPEEDYNDIFYNSEINNGGSWNSRWRNYGRMPIVCGASSSES
eukprot:TRINITY_DN12693_c0_g1_i1.p1 TRINITY_DN12693_c0_g1~~TRINITY_DN12693_c0_g1_i1.p1  ORF type:complete len:127 (-),score=18.61 TRINITY_DN12693_c0_g1_i1:76-456(-)